MSLKINEIIKLFLVFTKTALNWKFEMTKAVVIMFNMTDVGPQIEECFIT